jgi:hypothetical protein
MKGEQTTVGRSKNVFGRSVLDKRGKILVLALDP